VDSLILALDLALRGAAIALLLVIAFAVARQGAGRPVAWLGAALAVGSAAYAICSLPGQLRHISPWVAPVVALCAGNVVVFWLFTRAAFDDSFRPLPWQILLWLLTVACPVAAVLGADFVTSRPAAIAMRLLPVLFVLLAVAQTVRGWGADLVEGRRRLRLFILAAVALHTAISAVVDLSIGPDRVPPALHLLNAAALAGIAAIVAMATLRADLQGLFDTALVPSTPEPRAVAMPEPPDPAVLSELERLMTVERLYRHEGLSIGALATKVGISEHQLRRTINRGLGYRNFNEYLNRQRLADAKQALADPAQKDVPILTIALDAGFQSLGPFNRAFKAETGMTPTEFRRTSTPSGA
jgi:AraC-like DNA-binding protein